MLTLNEVTNQTLCLFIKILGFLLKQNKSNFFSEFLKIPDLKRDHLYTSGC